MLQLITTGLAQETRHRSEQEDPPPLQDPQQRLDILKSHVLPVFASQDEVPFDVECFVNIPANGEVSSFIGACQVARIVQQLDNDDIVVSHQYELLNASARHENLQRFLYRGSMQMVSLQCELLNVSAN